MSAVTGGVTKKRKKTDTKPQAQANKCLNEKRRREEENQRIEELAGLISFGFAEMSSLSVKPDKCAILQETVNQIRRIKEQEGGSSSDAVQQEEVSSSKPTILANEVFGPLLLEALEGFLFVVNTEGKVEFVTENICQFIRYTRDDVLGKSIYNIIHHGDHAKFSSTLMPISIGWTSEPQQHSRSRSFNCRLLVKPPDDREQTMEEKQQRVSQYENMQISSMLFPYPSDKSEEGGSGGSSGSAGEVTSESSEVGPCLMCVARRVPPNEKQPHQIGHTSLTLGSSNQISGAGGLPMVEQFTMKLDTSGRIIGVDTTGVSATYSQYLKDLMGLVVQELCHQQDQNKLAAHLKDTIANGHSTSAIYRLRVMGPDRFLHVQTKSKLFKSAGGGSSSSLAVHEPDFIMATHSIIGDHDLANTNNDSNALTAPGNSPRSLPPSVGQQSMCNNGSNSTSVSGLLQSPQGAGGSINGQITHASSPSPGPFQLNPNDYGLSEFPGLGDFFPPSTSWDVISGPDGSPDGPSTTTTADSGLRRHPPTPPSSWGISSDTHHPPRPDSVRSLTPASTPGPPANVTAFSPSTGGGICPSPLDPYSGGTRPSPSSSSPFTGSFPFSPMGEMPQQQLPRTPSYGGVVSGEESSPRESSDGNRGRASLPPPSIPLQLPPPAESARLRNLLTKRHVSGTDDELEDISEGSSASPASHNRNHILKGLLNQNDEEVDGNGREDGCRGGVSRMSSMGAGAGQSPASETPRTSGSNNMLLKLLNDKSDDDDVEARAGLKKQNELLNQLMKEPDGSGIEQGQDRWLDTSGSPMVSPHPSHNLHHQHSSASTPQTPPTVASQQEDSLLKSFVFGNSGGPTPQSPPSTSAPADSLSGGGHRVRKRPGDDGGDDIGGGVGPAKKKTTMTPSPSSPVTSLTSLIRVDSTHSSSQVSSSEISAKSNLCQKNRMLAMLLAQKPSEPANIPPIPASVISATPQEVLPRVTEQHKHSPASTGPGPGGGWSSGGLSSTTNSGGRVSASTAPTSSSTSFSDSVQQHHHRNSQQQTNSQINLHIQQQSHQHHGNQHQMGAGAKMHQGHSMNQQQQSQIQHDSFPDYRRSVADAMGDGGSLSCIQAWGENISQSSDPYLSSILDEVIDIVPDAIITDTSAISDILGAMDGMGAGVGGSIGSDSLTPSSSASSSTIAHCSSVSSSSSASVSSSTSSASISSSSQIGPPTPRPPTSSPTSSVGPTSSLSAASVSSYQQDMNAKLAINAIQKSLMLCETAVKAPHSPAASMATTPPAYPPSQVQGGFPQPNPPLYAQRPPPRFSSNLQQQQQQQAMGGMGQLGQLRGAAPQYGIAPNQVADGRHSLTPQALAQRRKILQQQAQKQVLLQQQQRLLHQQQQQQLLIPQGAAAAAAAVAAAAAASVNQQGGGGSSVGPSIVGGVGSGGVDPGALTSQAAAALHTMDSLLNSTVPPNVSLQRSTSVPDSQLSPGYGASGMLGSPLGGGGGPQISPGSMQQQQRLNQNSQQPPYSPHSQLPSPLGQQGFSPAGFGQGQGNGGSQARLSPHQSQGSNSVGSGGGGGGLPSFQQSQLSPRIPQLQGGYGTGGVMGAPGSGSGGGGGGGSGVVSWTQVQVARLSLQQQQNPMLNAQLTGNYAGGGGGGVGGRGYIQQQRQQQQQGGRSLPGGGNTGPQHGGQNQQQHSPYLMEGFPGSVSPPNNNLTYQNPQQQQFQQQQMRLQRTISAPGAPNTSSQGGGGGGGGTNGGSGGPITSEFVRQGLRAIVGARAQQHQHQTSPVGAQATHPNQGHQHNMRQQQQQQQQHIPTDLEDLGLTFEMPSGGPEGSPKLWAGITADLVSGGVSSGASATSPSPGLGGGGGPLRSPQGNNSGNSSNGTGRGPTVDGSPRPQQQHQAAEQPKASLLQKLLSE